MLIKKITTNILKTTPKQFIIKSVFNFSKGELQQHKPTAAQLHAQRDGIMAKVRLQKNYKLLNSSPMDGIQQIRGNFIQIKKKLTNRYYYMPNKKQYLLKLDHAYDQIMKVHEDYNIIDLGKPKGRVTKSQLITYQLQKIRKAKMYSLMQTYQFSAFVLFFLIIVQICIEEYEAKDIKRFKIIGELNIGIFISDIYNRIKSKVVNKIKEYSNQIDEKVTNQMIQNLKKNNIIIKESNSKESKIL